jgi:hypothetical protein
VSCHLCGFCTRDRELQVRVLFPVAKEEWELGQEFVEDLSGCGDRLRARVPVQAALEGLGRTYKCLPRFEVIGALELRVMRICRTRSGQTYDSVVELFQLRKVIIEADKVCHNCNGLGSDRRVLVALTQQLEEISERDFSQREDYRLGKRLGMKDSTRWMAAVRWQMTWSR